MKYQFITKMFFYYLIAFLRELLRHSNTNKLDAKFLGKYLKLNCFSIFKLIDFKN